MSAANKWDVKLNSRREIPHLQATLYYNNDVFWQFSEVSDYFQRFPKSLQKLSEGDTNVSEHFPKITGFTKTSGEDVSIKHQQI